MGRIQPSGHADADLAYSGRLKALREPGHLDVERLVAVLIEPGWIVRYEGEAIDASPQAQVASGRLENEGHATEAPVRHAVGDCRLVERTGPHALQLQPLDVNVRDGHLGLCAEALRLRELGPEFVNAGLAIPG